MYTTSDFKKGLRLMHDGQPFAIVDFQHHKPGKGAATVRTKMRNLITGQLIDPTFRSGEKFGRPDLEDKDVQYLYTADNIFHFMDPQSYDQYEISSDVIGDAAKFLMENMECAVLFYEEKAINIEMPNHVVLEIGQCDPAVRGDTVQGATKPAVMTTGHKCHVPLFVSEGEKIKVDTRTGDYIERA